MVWVGAGTSRPRKSWVARGATATRRRLPEGMDLTADVADDTDKKESESIAARMVVSGPSDFARPVRRLAHPRNPRNPRSLLWPVTRVPSPSALRAAAQPSGFAVGSAGPQTTQTHAEPGVSGLRLGARPYQSGGGDGARGEGGSRRRRRDVAARGGFSGSKNVRECQRIRQTQLRSSGESPLLSTWMKWSRWRTEWGFNRSRRGFHARRKVSRSGIPAGGGSLK